MKQNSKSQADNSSTIEPQKPIVTTSSPTYTKPMLAVGLFILKIVAWCFIISFVFLPSIWIIYNEGLLHYLKLLGFFVSIISFLILAMWAVSKTYS